MHVVHFVENLNRSSGGPSRSVPLLAAHAAAAGCQCSVVYEDRGQDSTALDHMKSGLRFVPVTREKLTDLKTFSKTMSLIDNISAFHIHGLWRNTSRLPSNYARRHGLPYVISPRGMLEPWAMAHKPIRKQLAMMLYQRRILAGANCLHATSTTEAMNLRAAGWTNKIVVIPNGTEFPDTTSEEISPSVDRQRTMLFMSRIHPVKGLPMLVDAWARVRPPGWRCQIVGPDAAGHLADVRERCRRNNVVSDFEFLGPVDGNQKWNLLRSSDLLVLPSHSENFGIVVAESLACGTPVIATRGTPWKSLAEHRCGWWIEGNTEALGGAIAEATALSDAERQSMGRRGYQFSRKEFAWDQIGRKMVSLYDWILGNAVAPALFPDH